MTLPRVTWNFLGVPRAIALVGDRCTMWGLRLRNVVKGWRTHNAVDHDTSRSMTRRHFGDPSCTKDNSPRWSCNPNHGFTERLRVSIRIIAG
jgi:hypothetical protein